jgi:hypothetical protein
MDDEDTRPETFSWTGVHGAYATKPEREDQEGESAVLILLGGIGRVSPRAPGSASGALKDPSASDRLTGTPVQEER